MTALPAVTTPTPSELAQIFEDEEFWQFLETELAAHLPDIVRASVRAHLPDIVKASVQAMMAELSPHPDNDDDGSQAA